MKTVSTETEVREICNEVMRENIAGFVNYEDLKRTLDNLYSGNSIVIPRNEDHARSMIQVASFYLNQHHKATYDALKKDYNLA